jgi:hypothetical protein
MATKKKSFVVDRSRWRSGRYGKYATGKLGVNGLASTFLLDENGSMCCLGFVAQQCGVPKKALLEANAPRVLDWVHKATTTPALIQSDGFTETSLTKTAIGINDNTKIDRKTREKRLKAVFKKHGYSIEFIGHYPKKGK